MKKIQVGSSDFKDLREGDFLFVDKSLFIKELIDDGSRVILIPRPRRFGKTLNMSMVKYFFDIKEEKSDLFKGLAIEQYNEIMKEQGQYPAIFISFKGIKARDIEGFNYKIKDTISNLYMKYDFLLNEKTLSDYEKEIFKSLIEKKSEIVSYENSLRNLISYLRRYYNKKVIVLIDEYDIPIQEGYLNNYYEESVSFIRNLLGAALKDNNDLYKGVLTGILKVAKESIFSGLNNISVYNLLSKRYNKFFGFTENEVINLLESYGLKEHKEKVQNWYNGYNFSGETIYNPWSVLNYINNVDDGVCPYWANTSGNDLIKELLLEGGPNLKSELELLISGETITKSINENIVMSEIKDSTENIWSFLLFSGYLKSVNKKLEEGFSICELKIPNEEVKFIYKEIILKTFRKNLKNDELKYMLKALTTGDIETFEMIFADIVEKTFSYFDVRNDGENFYHAFVLGLLVHLNKTHIVKSNRESGYGRYDVMIIPKDKTKIGIIIEFKKVNKRKKETLEMAIENGLKQIKENKYEVEMKEFGVENIIKMVIAFDGKEVLVSSEI